MSAPTPTTNHCRNAHPSYWNPFRMIQQGRIPWRRLRSSCRLFERSADAVCTSFSVTKFTPPSIQTPRTWYRFNPPSFWSTEALPVLKNLSSQELTQNPKVHLLRSIHEVLKQSDQRYRPTFGIPSMPSYPATITKMRDLPLLPHSESARASPLCCRKIPAHYPLQSWALSLPSRMPASLFHLNSQQGAAPLGLILRRLFLSNILSRTEPREPERGSPRERLLRRPQQCLPPIRS